MKLDPNVYLNAAYVRPNLAESDSVQLNKLDKLLVRSYNFYSKEKLETRPVFHALTLTVFGEHCESYEFTITRRFYVNGHIYIGGANGEVLDLTDYTARYRQMVADALSKA